MEYLKTKRTFIDVGAHIGHFSWNALGYFRRVIAFEPVRLNYECLVDNVEHGLKKMNRKPLVSMFNAAVGDKPIHNAEVWMSDPSGGKNSGAWELSLEPKGEFHKKMDIVPLDALQKVNDVDMLKIDVQGWEHKVIDGAVGLIERCKPLIIIEVVKDDTLDYSLIDRIKDMNYQNLALVQKNMIFRSKGT